MLLLYMLIIWQTQAIPQYPLNMFNINNHQDRYCLSYHSRWEYGYFTKGYDEKAYREQLMSYCFRPAEENNSMINFDVQNTDEPGFTFSELRQKNITSQMLLSWSSSIDMAEQYQIFLSTPLNSSSGKDIRFYNCTSLWFGPFCQFTFDYQIEKSFNDVVLAVFESKERVQEGMNVTCYKYLYCETLLSCLDWREICDGKIDCLGGSDEENCWQLEVNECNENEYRCHNGQCIPIEFFRDGSERPDCVDQTDEEWFEDDDCYQNPNFECEEITCLPGQYEFPCGDGQCINEISKCNNGRYSLLPDTSYSNTTGCLIELDNLIDYEWCLEFDSETNCTKVHCSMVSELRKFPLLFGHVRFMILNQENDSNENILPDYICYDVKLCTHFPPSTTHYNNLSCRHFNEFKFSNVDSSNDLKITIDNIKNHFRGCLATSNKIYYCNYSTMYQCKNSSKCISKYHLLDGIPDCPFNDDETINGSCFLSDIRQRFKCKSDGNDKCFAQLVVLNGKINCQYGEDEYENRQAFERTHISFQTICDGIPHLLPIFIDGQNDTDETDCEHWPCNNTYSRCNGFWLCKNGADEINCPSSACPQDQHGCVFPNDTSKVSCLSIARANNDFDDCLGGIDERTKYRVDDSDPYWHNVSHKFHCWNDTILISVDQLCDKTKNCRFNDDEIFCNTSVSSDTVMCMINDQLLTNIERLFCQLVSKIRLLWPVYFKLHNILGYPLQLSTNHILMEPLPEIEIGFDDYDTETYLTSDIAWWCNRGIPIGLRTNDNTSTLYCLCPPSYYGDRCQYQNQRVSLTIHIRVSSEWRSIFVFLITLIDNERNIESHDHIEYLPIRDCKNKYSIYLLYSTRPKNSSKTYSVQIDAFNQNTLNYRASWIFPLRFPFLPVHRLAILLNIPFSYVSFVEQQCSPSCIHGQYFHYVNDPNTTFCRCEHSWSGAQCNIKHKCDCAPGALCISNSICVCPPGRFGPRCHLFQSTSDSELCLNGGQSARIDVRYTDTDLIKSPWMCICPEEYIGDRCENEQRKTQIDISFHYKLTIPSYLIVHFIDVHEEDYLGDNRTSIAKKIQFDQNRLTLSTSTWFNIALAQILNQYYLIIVHEQTIISGHISTKILPSHRCHSIGELSDNTFSNQHLLKRIKYYHIPCQQQLELVCFHDDVHICLCSLDRTSNCFEFDHNMTYDCERYHYCGNNGHCFQDDFKCATTSFCSCHLCYFGSRCQFSTKTSALSLDIILGYHIRLNTGISQQSIIVKIAIALTTIMFVGGLINSFLSFQTFRGKQTRSIGCGHYLFTLSFISMFIISIFTLKFVLLVTSQIGSINNRSFLYIQCLSVDFLLRFLLSTNDWLNACVAVERAVNVIQGVEFNKAKSKIIAKWIAMIVVLFTSCTFIYDSIHRRLIDDKEEQRTWCVTQYSYSVQRFDILLNIFHFSVPFAINCISALTIIIVAARTRSNSQKSKSFTKHLHEQIHHHKHLLISPVILVILAVPRLIISFLSGCMKSPRDSWFYLIGYFISFIPSIMTFIVFVLPSTVYKKKFRKGMRRILL